MPLTAPDLALCIIVVAALAYRAFRAYLDLRERERLSATDKAALEQQLGEFRRWQTDVKNTLANLPRR